MTVKDYYQRVIQEIMEDAGISLLSQRPSYVLATDAELKEVVQYTEAFVSGRLDERPPYRYRRYLEVLRYLETSKKRMAHVDIGCGAGLFSWAFLDWSTEMEVGLDRLDLYGFDHSAEMIYLAQDISYRLRKLIPDYPALHYHEDVDSLLRALTSSHRDDTDYIVTFGHVLVQSHEPGDIGTFAEVITHILNMKDSSSTCTFVAVDARGSKISFGAGWDSLLKLLALDDVGHKELRVPTTRINSNSCAKIAMLYSG